MRRLAHAALLALTLSGCAYRYGATQPSGLHVYGGLGWDSGLAVGKAEEYAKTTGEDGDPVGTEVACHGYWLKPIGAGAAGLFAAHAFGDRNDGLGSAMLAAAIAIFLLPNCSATLTYSDRPEGEQRGQSDDEQASH